MGAPFLEVKDLHAGYGRAEVLTGLNFQLQKGQVVLQGDAQAMLQDPALPGFLGV